MYGWRNLLSKNRATKRNGREISSNGKSSGSVTGKEMEKVISAVGWFEKGDNRHEKRRRSSYISDQINST